MDFNSSGDKLLLIDGNALMHRAYHAIPPLTTREGEQVNAIFGFWSLLLTSIQNLRPRYVVFTFDKSEKTFRHQQYAEYKATRQKMEPDLAAQIPRLKETVAASGWPVFELDGFEADDLIGTISRQVTEGDEACQVYILTADMDITQLVDDRIFVYTAKHRISEVAVYDVAGVEAKFKGLRPDQVVDYKALRGDASDNIPGVAGVGEKTATELLLQYQHLDNVYANLSEIKPRWSKLLEEGRDSAYMSRWLATINREAPVEIDLVAGGMDKFNRGALEELFRVLEFRSLLNKLPEGSEKNNVNSVNGQASEVEQKSSSAQYELVENEQRLTEVLKEMRQSGQVAFDTETTGLDVWKERLLGVSVSCKAGTGYYVPWEDWSRQALEELMEDEGLAKIGHNAKFDAQALWVAGVEVRGIAFDTMLAAYILKEGGGRYGLKELAFEELGIAATPITELIGTGAKQLTLDMVDQKKVAEYAGADADHTWQLYELYRTQFEQKPRLQSLFNEIEMPVSVVLTEMERRGVRLDVEFMQQMSAVMQKKISQLESDIYQQVGHEFNLNSPKQLSGVLFDELHLPVLKKTKTGRSTNEAVLKDLSQLHPVVELLLRYRELFKLRSTYVESLPDLVGPTDGRIHTSYNQAVASTGRLSSSSPNLQNIPIKTEMGREIRKAFVADDEGSVLVSIDYSQIELRVLAYVSQDVHLLEAFAAGEDVHRSTAAKVFGCGVDEVTSDQRRIAKTINFGIMYGQSAYGLAQQLKVSREEAGRFIEDYFEVYDGVRSYLDESIRQAREDGYVETIFGRRLQVPDLQSKNFQLKMAAERVAVNMPIQGSAADIIKLAMIDIEEYLKGFPEVGMLLQVHDELVFNVPKDRLEQMIPELVGRMEGVGQCLPDKGRSVALVAEAAFGPSWGDMEDWGK